MAADPCPTLKTDASIKAATGTETVLLLPTPPLMRAFAQAPMTCPSISGDLTDVSINQLMFPDAPGEYEAVTLGLWIKPICCNLAKRLPRGLAAAADKDMLDLAAEE